MSERCSACLDVGLDRSHDLASCPQMLRWYANRKNVAAEGRVKELEDALRRIASACGNPDPAEACRVVLGIVRETLEAKG
jgi:hypothetical protein